MRVVICVHHPVHFARQHGARGNLGPFLRQLMPQWLADRPGAAEQCSGVVGVAMTRLAPVMHTEVITHFTGHEDLIEALLVRALTQKLHHSCVPHAVM